MIVEIHEPIGSGALARVFRATDDLDRTVAVKLLSLSAEQVSTAREHARAFARVSHPNIVYVHGVEPVTHPETGEQVQGIVMEYIQGENLYERAAGPPMDAG